MQKTKRILWIAAVLAAVLTVAVAGCKHDDEDDWTPLTIRNAVLEKYAGERTTVTIPDGVTGIGSKAFSGTAVTAVVIPSGVTDIAPDAFDDSKVTSISFIGSQEDWNKRFGGELAESLREAGITVSCFIIDDKDVLIGYEGDETDIVIPAGFVKGIDAGVFSGRGITGVTIPGSVRRVGAEAFADCTALADVRIEAGVACIGEGAFARCTGLESMGIPAGVTELGGGVLDGCTGLAALSIHESVTTIAPGALTGTEQLKDIKYSGKKALWERLVADNGIGQDFAGKTVTCVDGVWSPGQGTTTPGDGTGDHIHTWTYINDGESGHYQACECGERTETEEHVYDDADTECNKCGYRKANGGDPNCKHEYITKQTADGHYTGCAHCAYVSDFENHTWGNYEKIDDDKHRETCKRCNYSAEVKHNYGEVEYKDDGHHRICADCKHSKIDDHTFGEYTYSAANNEHDKTCTVTECGHTEHVDCQWSKYTDDKSTETHTRTCTATGTEHKETENHRYTYRDSQTHLGIKHKKMCETCDYSVYEDHDWKYEREDDEQHEKGCAFCTYGKSEMHNYKCADNNDGTHTKTCEQDCMEPVTEKHKYVDNECVCGKRLEITGGTIDENGVLIEYPGHSETHIVIPDGVTGIGSNVFWEHWELESIVIPEGVESIGDAAFAGCHALTEVSIPSTVETIGGGAFQNCSKLEHLEIASGVKNIDHGAFQGCGSLTEVTIPGTVEMVGQGAFQGCSALKKVVIASGVKSIDYGAFQDCVGLTELTIPGTVETIGSSAFQKCTGLKEVTIDYGVKEIGNDAFQGCSGLTKVTIPNSVKTIGNNAFEGCVCLGDITIPENVTSIGTGALNCGVNLKTITFKGTKEAWNKLVDGKDIGLTSNVTITCSDGELP